MFHDADVVAHDDDDVGLFGVGGVGSAADKQTANRRQCKTAGHNNPDFFHNHVPLL